MSESFLKIEGVSKSFGNNKALDNVSLDINKSELFSLLGSSGCGKSTLLRIIAGFEKPDSGRIYLDGEDITSLPPYLRPLNIMFQNYALFPHLNVKKNIEFGLKEENLENNEIEVNAIPSELSKENLQGLFEDFLEQEKDEKNIDGLYN